MDEQDRPDQRPRREVTWVALEPRRLRRTLLTVGVALLLFQVAWWSFSALAGFAFDLLLAWLIAISMDPVVAGLARRGWKRGAAAGLVLGSVTVLVVALGWLMGGALTDQVDDLASALPTLAHDGATWVNGTFGARIDADGLVASVSVERVADTVASSAGGMLHVVSGMLGALLTLITVVVFAFYFSADAQRIQRFVASWMPQHRQKVFIQVWDISVDKAGRFVLSKVALAAASALCHALFFHAVDVPYWLPMGIFAGVVSQFVPVVGTYVGIIVPAILAATVDTRVVVAVVLFATFYQQIENYILTPKIAKVTLDIHPALALAAVFAAAALVGPIGALIGIPVVAICWAVIDEYGKRYELHPELHAALGDESESGESRDGNDFSI